MQKGKCSMIEDIKQGQKRAELMLYAGLWAILFIASALSEYMDDATFEWSAVWNTWKFLAMFAITFFVHNFLIAPLLVYRNKQWAYGAAVCLLLLLFFGYQMVRGVHEPPRDDFAKDELREGMERSHGGIPSAKMMPPREKEGPPQRGPRRPGGPRREAPNLMRAKPFGGPTTVAMNIMLLLLCLNLGVKYYFKSLDIRKRMKDLERDNLNQQLQYLKYQINPHFFMNTLNNIHALVDIDPEEAKRMIEVLSKLMRYVLYEADRPMGILQKEIDFLKHYIELMRIRYTDSVRIGVVLPSSTPNVQVPSLLFATFVENAFKHGVSYCKKSFIEITMRIDEAEKRLVFVCRNSKKTETEALAEGEKKEKSGKRESGVGLKNAVKRLNLMYGKDYQLTIDDKAEAYRLMLTIPLK